MTYYTRNVLCWDLWLVGQPVSSQRLTWNLKKTAKMEQKSIWTKPNLPILETSTSSFFSGVFRPYFCCWEKAALVPRSTPFHPWLNKAHRPAWCYQMQMHQCFSASLRNKETSCLMVGRNPKQPPGMVLKPYINIGISTTFPSTGEFTGFLNHQQYYRYSCSGGTYVSSIVGFQASKRFQKIAGSFGIQALVICCWRYFHICSGLCK